VGCVLPCNHSHAGSLAALLTIITAAQLAHGLLLQHWQQQQQQQWKLLMQCNDTP